MTSPSAAAVTGIGQLAIVVQDLERATAFYRDVLEVPFLFAAGNMAFFQCGEVRLLLGTAERPELDHPASIVYYRVADIAAAHRRLVERGAVFEREPQLTHRADDHELWIAFFHDSEGNLAALMSEVPTS